MVKWEYLSMWWNEKGNPKKGFSPNLPDDLFASLPSKFEHVMNALGQEGWEAYWHAADSAMVYVSFKRQIP